MTIAWSWLPSIRRLAALIAMSGAALALSGCLVIAQNGLPPDADGTDARLIGTWRSSAEDGEEAGVYLHVLRDKTGTGMHMVLVDKDSFLAFEAVKSTAGKRTFLNVTALPLPGLMKDMPEALGVHIVLYEVKGTQVSLRLMSSASVTDAIEDGAIAGTIEGSGASRGAKLTASPAALKAWLAGDGADRYFAAKPTVLRRLAN